MKNSNKNKTKPHKNNDQRKTKNNKDKKSDDEIIKLIQEQYNQIDVSSINTFEDLPLSEKTLRGLRENTFEIPTDIQKQTLAISLPGFDVLGAAKTGSGKTLAFLIPILEKLFCLKWSSCDGVGALIITPTRELAHQIFETLKLIGYYHDFSAGLLIGGREYNYEKERLDQCNIIICTPGRLLQHMDETPLFDCNSLQILVLDEADRCLDLGFEQTMNNIIDNLPQNRQTLLFSATQTRSIRDLARLSLKDPRYISVHADATYATPEGLEQSYIVCELHDKMAMLWSFINNHRNKKILVFLSSCKLVRYYFEIFCRLRPKTRLFALYGSLHQLRRLAVYEEFRQRTDGLLFATDIAARGLDFPAVHWVLQMDCPEDAITYIHRAGRTARYFEGGESLLVLLPNEEKAMLKQLEEKKIPINKIEINTNKLHNPIRRVEAILAKYPEMKAIAQRAFISYAKSVFLMKNKAVFDVRKLDTNAFSRSLGLAVPPRIRFLERINKQKSEQEQKKLNKSLDNNNENFNENDQTLNNKNTNYETKNTFNRAKDLQFNFEVNNEDGDSEEELFHIKRINHDIDDNDEDLYPLENDKNKKPVTKAALAKKIIKKKLTINKKIKFGEEGEVILNRASGKVSELGKEYEAEDDTGLDIEKAKQVLKEEDKFDKQFFRELIKAKHREEKLKAKCNKESDSDESDEEYDEPDLSWLPDPDKVYSKGQDKDDNDSDSDVNEAEDSEENEEEDSKDNTDDSDVDSFEAKPSTSKRKIKSTKSKTKKKARLDNIEEVDLDTGLSLMQEEEMALRLLQNKQ